MQPVLSREFFFILLRDSIRQFFLVDNVTYWLFGQSVLEKEEYLGPPESVVTLILVAPVSDENTTGRITELLSYLVKSSLLCTRSKESNQLPC